MASDLLLDVRDLSVTYGPVHALRGVSLQVSEGEIVALVGANGAGKTTLLESVLALTHVDAGHIHYGGRDITRSATEDIVAGGIALVPEGRGIFAAMSVRENLRLGALHARKDYRESLQAMFELFPILKERQGQAAGTLSGGEQQMLSLSRGLMSRPRLLILDEPSLGLSPSMVTRLVEMIQRLGAEGQSILLAEQNAAKALEVATRAYVIEKGAVVISGLAEDLRQDPRVHRAYFGGHVSA